MVSLPIRNICLRANAKITLFQLEIETDCERVIFQQKKYGVSERLNSHKKFYRFFFRKAFSEFDSLHPLKSTSFYKINLHI